MKGYSPFLMFASKGSPAKAHPCQAVPWWCRDTGKAADWIHSRSHQVPKAVLTRLPAMGLLKGRRLKDSWSSCCQEGCEGDTNAALCSAWSNCFRMQTGGNPCRLFQVQGGA